MDSEAYWTLRAIARDPRTDLTDRQHWVKAFKAIRWVVQTDGGLQLTLAGRDVLDELAVRRGAPVDPAPRRLKIPEPAE